MCPDLTLHTDRPHAAYWLDGNQPAGSVGSLEVPPPTSALHPVGWRLEVTCLAGGARGRWRRGSTAGAPSVGCTAHCAVQSPHQAGCGGEAVVVPS